MILVEYSRLAVSASRFPLAHSCHELTMFCHTM